MTWDPGIELQLLKLGGQVPLSTEPSCWPILALHFKVKKFISL
ncbi:rCG24216 [Rattus norvegicus]|uniref:RCG24216 n=1 Tax=Rattus norvegicus TaxID=10116 RepID=A6KAL7_RAT|nr:rCG24216 [Rattus norvegicus]